MYSDTNMIFKLNGVVCRVHWCLDINGRVAVILQEVPTKRSFNLLSKLQVSKIRNAKDNLLY